MEQTKNKTKHQDSSIPRRGFLKKLWVGLGAVAGLEVVWVFSSFFSPSERKSQNQIISLKTVGNLNQIHHSSKRPSQIRLPVITR